VPLPGTAGVAGHVRGYDENMLVDVVAVLVLLLMAADVARMLLVDDEPHGEPARRSASRHRR
jgi:hypothetical protein